MNFELGNMLPARGLAV